jgi:hypothetical protein
MFNTPLAASAAEKLRPAAAWFCPLEQFVMGFPAISAQKTEKTTG